MITKTLETTRIKETMPVSVQPSQKIYLESSQNRAQGESCSIHTYDLTREMKAGWAMQNNRRLEYKAVGFHLVTAGQKAEVLKS